MNISIHKQYRPMLFNVFILFAIIWNGSFASSIWAFSTLEKIRLEADYILACQYMNSQDPAHGAINNVYGAPTWVVPRENAMAILALLEAAEVLQDGLYLDRAQLAADYLIRVQDPADGAWYDQYRYVEIAAESKSPTQTAEVLLSLYRLGYDHDRYLAMKHGAHYLIDCQKVENAGGNDDGLLCGGKNADGQYYGWRWAHDNAYAYWAFRAAEAWAMLEDDWEFSAECAHCAYRIISGINTFLYDPGRGVWYAAIDENGTPIRNPQLPCLDENAMSYPSWIQYAPQMLDLPARGVNSSAVGEWIHGTFQQPDNSCIGHECNDGGLTERKYPGLSFQAALCWFDLGYSGYAEDAVAWAEGSGLWQTEPAPNGIRGGWIDWIENWPEPGQRASWWLRFIDTSFYAMACWNGGYNFSISPRPDIQANGSDGPVTMNRSATLTVAIALDNNGREEKADWWLAVDTPCGVYFYTVEGWTPELRPVYQGSLCSLSRCQILAVPVEEFPIDTYTFYFGVDTCPDGDAAADNLYCDHVIIHITG